MLAASAPSGGVAAGGAFSGSPISLALARPLASRPAAATFDDAADAMPLRVRLPGGGACSATTLQAGAEEGEGEDGRAQALVIPPTHTPPPPPPPFLPDECIVDMLDLSRASCISAWCCAFFLESVSTAVDCGPLPSPGLLRSPRAVAAAPPGQVPAPPPSPPLLLLLLLLLCPGQVPLRPLLLLLLLFVRGAQDMRTAGYFVDAGLGMGRGFRVGWGPGGMLVIPGAFPPVITSGVPMINTPTPASPPLASILSDASCLGSCASFGAVLVCTTNPVPV